MSGIRPLKQISTQSDTEMGQESLKRKYMQTNLGSITDLDL